VLLPASATASSLAEALGVDREAVIGALAGIGEDVALDEFIGSDLVTEVAGALGFEAAVEPRDLALERLYEHEVSGTTRPSEGRADHLVSGILTDLDGLDRRIEAASEHWSVARMPSIDRNILRIALFELEHDAETPTAVIVSEAVRLANTYSTEKSAHFVNGILAALARSARE
jgi:N utilization substance protein B